MADVALSSLGILVGKHHLAGRTVIDQGLIPENQSVVEHLPENPLGPLVVFFVGGVDRPAPVKAEAYLLQLFRKVGNVPVGNDPGVYSVFYGIVLGGKAEGIKPDGKQHIIALHPPFSGDDLHAGVGLDVSHMHSRTGGVGKFNQPVEFGHGKVILGSEALLLFPTVLPLFFNGFIVVFHNGVLSQSFFRSCAEISSSVAASQSFSKL